MVASRHILTMDLGHGLWITSLIRFERPNLSDAGLLSEIQSFDPPNLGAINFSE